MSTIDVIFKTEDGALFRMKVGQSHTVLEMKQKIHKFTGIPISHQILALQDQVLDDSSYVESWPITESSRIHLCIKEPYRSLSSQPQMVDLLLKLPDSTSLFCVTMNRSDSILQLKHKIHENQRLPINRMGLYMSGKKLNLQDAKCLSDYGLSDGSVIDVVINPAVTQSCSSVSNKLKIRVVASCLYLQVSPTDKVQVLRDELEKLRQEIKFELSPDYFFIHEQSVIDECESFQENNINQGDEIEIVSGTVPLLIQQLLTGGNAHIASCKSCSSSIP